MIVWQNNLRRDICYHLINELKAKNCEVRERSISKLKNHNWKIVEMCIKEKVQLQCE